MFFEQNADKALRFGDVLRGYIATTPNIKEPIFREPVWIPLNEGYRIDINLPAFCVVVSPCCSIGKKTISLTPLIKVLGSFFNNPYFSEDLTRINRKMDPKQAVPLGVWDTLPAAEQKKRLEEGLGYACLEQFIYEKNELFPTYVVDRKEGNVETNYYMIDFRNIYKLTCDKIVTPKDAPLDSKCLQLTVESRKELRDKISYYFATPPEEDKVLLED